MPTTKKLKNKDRSPEEHTNKLVSEHLSSVDFISESVCIKKKHKKKRCDSDDAEKHITGQNPVTEVSEFGCGEIKVKDIKAKKSKHTEKSICTETSDTGCIDSQSPKHKKKKNKSKETESSVLNKVNSNYESACDQSSCGRNRDKQSKKQKLDVQDDINKEIQDLHGENQFTACVSDGVKHKKKHKKHKHRDSSLHETNNKINLELERQELNNVLNKDFSNTEENPENKKRKKLKKKDHSSFSDANDRLHNNSEIQDEAHCLNQSSECIEKANHSKKRKRHRDAEYLELDITKNKKQKDSSKHTNEINENEHGSGNVLSKCEQTSSRTCEKEESKHHKKKKKHSKEKQSPTSDNIKNTQLSTDSVGKNINEPEQNQSSLSSAEISTTSSAPIQGQWQGDLFENSDRQNKFLRLLGGMKKLPASSGNVGNVKKCLTAFLTGTKPKGLFGSLSSLVKTSSQRGSNTAMSAADAANLNQKLEEEYNRAMNFKLSGKVGTGFGFVPDPAEGKKFHIDVHKTKSIKFDD